MADSSLARRILIWALRLLILAAVIFGVGHTFQNAAARIDAHDWQVRPVWLVASGALYIAGLVPTAWFWQRVLAALGQPVPWQHAFNAHFLGHLGKYVPGKALVVVLRIGGVRRWITSTWLAVISTLLETMLMMAVGAFLAAVLLAITLPMPRGMTALAFAIAAVCLLPTLPPLARFITHKGLRRFHFTMSDPLTHATAEVDAQQLVAPITWRLWASGWIASLACWTLFGLSLWAMLRAIGVESVHPIVDLPFLVGAVSLAVVGGFVSFLPGGVLVRDALLLQLLTPVCGEANALVAAVLLRLVWLVSEVLICGILYVVAIRWRAR